MSSAGFEPAIPEMERLPTQALDLAAIGISSFSSTLLILKVNYNIKDADIRK
jgi:hypothetical protein